MPLAPYIPDYSDFDPARDWVWYAGPWWSETEIAVAVGCLRGGKWLAAGENVRRFERAFSEQTEVEHSVMVNSGSSANLLMLAACKEVYDWREGDGVILSPVAFPTTVAAVVQNNLRPIFVDVSAEDFNLNLHAVRDAIHDGVRAIFLSPLLGNPPDVVLLSRFAKRHGLTVLLDNCDSLGSRWGAKLLTSHAAASSCSFYAAHHICTGEGGMVSSPAKTIVNVARGLAEWGRSCLCSGGEALKSNGRCGRRFSKWLDDYDGTVDHRYHYNRIGYNLKPLDWQGAVGLVQLGKLDEIVRRRREHKQRIQGSFKQYIPAVDVIEEFGDASASWFAVPVVCPTRQFRDRLVAHLEANRIQTRPLFAGNLLLHPGYRHLDSWRRFPNATAALERGFFVGCSPAYTETVLNYIDDVLGRFEP